MRVIKPAGWQTFVSTGAGQATIKFGKFSGALNAKEVLQDE